MEKIENKIRFYGLKNTHPPKEVEMVNIIVSFLFWRIGKTNKTLANISLVIQQVFVSSISR